MKKANDPLDYNDVIGVIGCARILAKNNSSLQGSEKSQVIYALDAMLGWLKGPRKLPLTVQDLKGGLEESTFDRKVVSKVRRAIEQACRTLKTTEVLYFKKYSPEDRHLVFVWLQWEENELLADEKTQLKYFTHYRENTFVDQLLLGMAHGAEVHGIKFHIHRVNDDEDVILESENDSAKGIKPIYMVDWSNGRFNDVLETKLKKNGHIVVSTANAGSAIAQSNGVVGEYAAQFLIKNGLQKGDEVVVTRPVAKDGTSLSENTPTEQRFYVFKQNLEKVGAIVVELPVPDMRMGGIISATAEIVREYIKTKHPKALFATSGDAGLAATIAIPEWKSIPIVSADMTSELIQLMLERSNCLQALVGISPYYYGLLKMKRLMQDPPTVGPVHPLVLDRFNLTRELGKIRSMYELVNSGYFDGTTTSHDTKKPLTKPVIVAILGGSASGKTTLSQIIKRRSSINEVTTIPIDAFYHDHLKHDENPDFEVRDAFDWTTLKEVLNKLLNGEMARIPTYHYSSKSRSVSIAAYPTPIIILEGLHAFDSAIFDLVDLKYFVDLPKEARYERRRIRDVEDPQRGQTINEFELKWARSEVVYNEFIEPKKFLEGVGIIQGHHDFSDIALKVLRKARSLRT